MTDTSVARGRACPARSRGAASGAPTLADVIRAFKSISAIQVNRVLIRTGQPLWQRSYYEHIIRNETSLERIREYIAVNPQNWMMDQENTVNRSAASDFEKELGLAHEGRSEIFLADLALNDLNKAKREEIIPDCPTGMAR